MCAIKICILFSCKFWLQILVVAYLHHQRKMMVGDRVCFYVIRLLNSTSSVKLNSNLTRASATNSNYQRRFPQIIQACTKFKKNSRWNPPKPGSSTFPPSLTHFCPLFWASGGRQNHLQFWSTCIFIRFWLFFEWREWKQFVPSIPTYINTWFRRFSDFLY